MDRPATVPPPAPGDRAAPWLLAGAVLALYAATACPDFGGVSADTGNYALALEGFDPARARPHLPGSWLLVALLRFPAAVLGPHGALLALAIGASACAAGLGYGLARDHFGPATAWLLTALVATQPVAWFFGTVPEVYALDLLLGLLAVRLGRTRRGLLALPVAFALAAGLRLATPALLAPLYAWLWWRGRGRWRPRAALAAHVAALGVLVLVLAPQVRAAGGPAAYLDLFGTHLTVAWSLPRNVWGMALFLAPLAPTVLVLLLAGGRGTDAGAADRATLLLWLVPPLAFFVLGHYQKGYVLLVLWPLLVLLLRRVAPARRRGVLGALVALQAGWFLFAPYRPPDPAVLMAPRARSIGLAEVGWQRVRSTHLMALARTRELAAAAAELDTILAAAPGTEVVVDPSFPLPLRALQVSHPDRAFTVLDVLRPDAWRRHAGDDESTGTGVAARLAAGVLVGRRDVVALVTDVARADVIHAGPRFFAVRLSPPAAAAAAERYAELFAR